MNYVTDLKSRKLLKAATKATPMTRSDIKGQRTYINEQDWKTDRNIEE